MRRYLKVLILAFAVAAVGIGCDLHSIINPIRGDWQSTGGDSTYAYEETISFRSRDRFEVTGSVTQLDTATQYDYAGEGTYEVADGTIWISAYLNVNQVPFMENEYYFLGTYVTGTTSYDNERYLYLTDALDVEYTYVRQ